MCQGTDDDREEMEEVLQAENPKWGTPEWHKQNPIFGTDFSKSPDELIENIRCQLANIRGQLNDISRGYPGFGDRLNDAGGTLTLCISYLYHVLGDLIKLKKQEK
ncbi:MAG: hypothetical protein WC895_04630 [Candidatus Shapirobacteria bacterium]|jgi:hypothetical protein